MCWYKSPSAGGFRYLCVVFESLLPTVTHPSHAMWLPVLELSEVWNVILPRAYLGFLDDETAYRCEIL